MPHRPTKNLNKADDLVTAMWNAADDYQHAVLDELLTQAGYQRDCPDCGNRLYWDQAECSTDHSEEDKDREAVRLAKIRGAR